MDETTLVQGREITQDDIELVRRLLEADPSGNRTPNDVRAMKSNEILHARELNAA